MVFFLIQNEVCLEECLVAEEGKQLTCLKTNTAKLTINHLIFYQKQVCTCKSATLHYNLMKPSIDFRQSQFLRDILFFYNLEMSLLHCKTVILLITHCKNNNNR